MIFFFYKIWEAYSSAMSKEVFIPLHTKLPALEYQYLNMSPKAIPYVAGDVQVQFILKVNQLALLFPII